ncbi:MAG: MATE family efflux transporter [Lentisphaeria bacterium]|nr:MATE family efflux transporter [Lentisphaeria bacterium]
MAINRYNMDMCNGPLAGKMIRYAIPLLIAYILQYAFHAADLLIIGNCSTYESMAAIGTTADLNSFTINLLVGISVGANILAAQFYGAGDRKNLSRTIHTSMCFAFIGGIAIGLLGILCCEWALRTISVPEAILPKSALYMKLIFCGMPFSMIYNFGCSILRAGGDTQRPLYYLIAAGIVNVGLNLLFVAGFKWDIAGVAIATVISQAVSAVLVLRAMMTARGASRLVLRHIHIDIPVLKKLLIYGVPAGFQGCCFALSNIIIQGAINSFGSQAMAGMTPTVCMEWILYATVHAAHQTTIVFVGQNYGGCKIPRIMRSLKLGFAGAFIIGGVLGACFTITGPYWLALFNDTPEVIEWGMRRVKIVFTLYCLCGLMDVAAGGLRGLGHSVIPTVCALLFACGLRVVWINTVFAYHHTIETLVWAYPLTWTVTFAANGIFLWWFCRKLVKQSSKGYVALKV